MFQVYFVYLCTGSPSKCVQYGTQKFKVVQYLLKEYIHSLLYQVFYAQLVSSSKGVTDISIFVLSCCFCSNLLTIHSIDSFNQVNLYQIPREREILNSLIHHKQICLPITCSDWNIVTLYQSTPHHIRSPLQQFLSKVHNISLYKLPWLESYSYILVITLFLCDPMAILR